MKLILLKSRWKRIILITLLILFVLFVVPTIILGELIYSAPRTQDYANIDGMVENQIETSDGVIITIWADDNTTSKAILLVHGHFDHSSLIEERYSSIFRNLGYSIVTVDLRNHGRSEHAPPVTMGIDEAEDIVATLNWMSERWEDIGIFGTSMGSIAGLLAHDISQIANFIIMDSSFDDPIEVMNRNFEKNYIFQPWRFLVVQYLTKFRFSRDFPDIMSILNNLEIPTLVAHGSDDIEASPAFLEEVDMLNNSYISTILVEGGEHSRLHIHQEFAHSVEVFLEAM